MAKATLVLDSRKARKDGKLPLTIRVMQRSKSTSVSLGLTLHPEEWNPAACEISDKHPRWRQLRPWVQQMYLTAQLAVLQHQYSPLAAIKDAVVAALFPERVEMEAAKASSRGLLWAIREKGSTCKPSTKLVYDRALKHVESFTQGKEVPFAEATPSWLAKLDQHMAQSAPAQNARAILFRHIRAAVNWAIAEGICPMECYPFRKFKIKAAPTRKRSLKAEDIADVINADVPKWAQRYVDFFSLSFYLIGINPKDLLYLRPSDLVDGRIEYARAKTGKLYSIKVEPEAMAIIDKYRGSELLLSIMEGKKDYMQFVRQADYALGKIREGLTLYWARHSWATIAASLDVPRSTISKALGHSEGLAVTEVYVDFDLDKVDKANRKVLDHVKDQAELRSPA